MFPLYMELSFCYKWIALVDIQFANIHSFLMISATPLGGKNKLVVETKEA